MRIIFLGTNGWYDSPTGNTLCVFIESEKYYVVLDAGSGFYKLGRHIGKDKPTLLFLSHFHLDHIFGLHTLVKFSFYEKLKIFGPEGIKDILRIIINEPFSIPQKDLPFEVEAFELPREKEELPFQVECMELFHTSLTLGYRLHLDEKIIAYCPDTGYCHNAVELAKDAALLIAECSFRSGESNPEWPHLNPQGASKIAKEAGVQKLVLTHFDASRYPTIAARKEAEKVAKEIFPNTNASVDGMEIEI